MEAFPFIQKYLFPCFAVIAILVISFVVAHYVTTRDFDRRDRASAVAKTIDAEIMATRATFNDKYMPLLVGQVLHEARATYLRLEDRSWSVGSQAQFDKLATQAAATIAEIKAAVASPFTAEAMESDRLALIAELAEAEETAVEEKASAEASLVEELANIASSLECQRGRIAKSQAMLAAMAS